MVQAFCNEQTDPDIFREMGKIGLLATTLNPGNEGPGQLMESPVRRG